MEIFQKYKNNLLGFTFSQLQEQVVGGQGVLLDQMKHIDRVLSEVG